MEKPWHPTLIFHLILILTKKIHLDDGNADDNDDDDDDFDPDQHFYVDRIKEGRGEESILIWICHDALHYMIPTVLVSTFSS